MWVTVSPPDIEYTLSPTIVAHAPLDGGIEILSTSKVEIFAGRNFRDLANFSVVRESLYPQNRSFQVVRESLYPRNFLKFLKKLKTKAFFENGVS